MKILFSIIFNAFILFAINYFLWASEGSWLKDAVILACENPNEVFWTCAYITYLIGGTILWLINYFIKPILKILALPFLFFFYGFALLAINAILLYMMTFVIKDILQVPWVWYEITDWVSFAIAVAIFSILNMVYSFLIFKK